MRNVIAVSLIMASLFPLTSSAQKKNIPDVLKLDRGVRVKTVDEWEQIRRPEIREAFSRLMYGYSPAPPELSYRMLSNDRNVLGGKAVRKQVRVFFAADTSVWMDILMYFPMSAKSPVPVFLGMNFYGNQTVSSDPGILITPNWVNENEAFGVENNRATEASRGVRTSRWPIERILERGYGVATIYYGDLDPDFDDGFANGVHGLLDKGKRTESSWGAIAAWAWGLQRAMDYLATDSDVDASKVAVLGHSRLGKAALWAGATDERFAIVISNESGEGGAALTRNEKGESLEQITTRFPHWFCSVYKSFAGRVNDLPFDQHMLLAMVAPRPLYVASAAEDLWADPEGEFLSAVYAEPVYKLYGVMGLGTSKMPAVDQPVQKGTIGYHIRAGKHDLTAYDWEQFMNFADKHWRKK
ncbi:MAG: dienelactone hydrolase family protein [Cyclobacteriaceae bacterium]|jgi:hypothetical protein|nr:dienelactone hydrolase family protein [Cyclobacteriaceae bacterium]